MITAAECRAVDKTTCRYHKHTVAEIEAARTLAAAAGVSTSLADQTARNFAAREEEKKAVFRQEWRERANDWKQYGFQFPISVRKALPTADYLSADRATIEALTADQVQAIKFFSSNNYRWINPALYGTQELSDATDGKSIQDFDLRHMATHEVEQNPTKAQLAELTTALDAALTHELAQSRVIYRGMQAHNPAIQAKTVEELHAYVDNAYKIGSTVKFDGYLSASPSPKVALAYSRRENGMGVKSEGIFFELLTKHGVNITQAALYSREAETLLPRNTKWKVAAVHKSKTVRYELVSRYTEKNYGKATLIQLVEVD